MNLSELYNIFYEVVFYLFLSFITALVLYVVLVGMSEVTYYLFFARNKSSLAEEIVSGEINCEK
jgi:hypothetical protein